MAPVKGATNSNLTYGGTAITAYLSQVDLQATIGQLEVTNLDSTGKVFLTEPTEWVIRGNGFWESALDTAIGPDAVTPGTKRNAVIDFINGGVTVTYTWTANAEVANYNITAPATGVIGCTFELRLSGAPVRNVV